MSDLSAERMDGVATVALSRRLKDAGLEWSPRRGDRFMVPDRHLDDHVFALSDMVVEMRNSIGGMPELAFNGTVEWALDSILTADVVWLPSEADLRAELGDAFIGLYRDVATYGCVVRISDEPTVFEGRTAVQAYGAGLLALLRHS